MIDEVQGSGDHSSKGPMNKRPDITCDDCYFRREGLCALAVNVPCPTFRLATGRPLAPPPQPQLVPRPAVVQHAA
jgi:hypothetical protein